MSVIVVLVCAVMIIAIWVVVESYLGDAKGITVELRVNDTPDMGDYSEGTYALKLGATAQDAADMVITQGTLGKTHFVFVNRPNEVFSRVPPNFILKSGDRVTFHRYMVCPGNEFKEFA